ncbi:opioid growth factor receptor-related protein [Rhizobacter fulvus]
MQRLFVDAEFNPAPDAKQLPAIGLISEDGSASCYLGIHDEAETPETADRSNAKVVPLFGRAPGAQRAGLAVLGRRLGSFLRELGEPVSLCYDDRSAWQLVEAALMAAGCWKELAPHIHARNVHAEVADGNTGESSSPVAPRLALERARALRTRWLCRPALDRTRYGVLRSFLGYRGLDSHGSTLFTMLSQSDEWMGAHTTFIQWMLPTAERSMFTQRGPLLTSDEIERLSLDHRVRAGIALSRDRVLRYLGLELREGLLLKRESWQDSSEWSRVAGPDDLRVSRLLRSLVLFGLAEDARALYRGLESLVRGARSEEAAEQVLGYWRAASFKETGQP